jgi:hypothetical protein
MISMTNDGCLTTAVEIENFLKNNTDFKRICSFDIDDDGNRLDGYHVSFMDTRYNKEVLVKPGQTLTLIYRLPDNFNINDKLPVGVRLKNIRPVGLTHNQDGKFKQAEADGLFTLFSVYNHNRCLLVTEPIGSYHYVGTIDKDNFELIPSYDAVVTPWI